MTLAPKLVLIMGMVGLNALSVFGGTVDVIFYDNRFGTINDANGAYTQIGTLPLNASSGIASLNNLLYVEDLGGDLFRIDPITGASTAVGFAGVSDTSTVFAGTSSALFEIDYASNLYSLNPVSGKATLVGPTGIPANNGWFDTSLSSDGTFLYYTSGQPGANDELYRIDISTGLATDLGSTGVTGIAGSAFVNGKLELYQYGQNANYIYSAPAGSTQFVKGSQLAAQIIDGGVSQVNPSASSQSSAIPEPSSAVLAAIGALLIGLAWAKRRAKPDQLVLTELENQARHRGVPPVGH